MGKRKVRVRSEFSEKFGERVKVNQESVLWQLVFANGLDVKTDYARQGLMNRILNAGELVFTGETVENSKKKFLK